MSRRGRAAVWNIGPLRWPSAATLTMTDLELRDRRTPVCRHSPTQHHLRITRRCRQISNGSGYSSRCRGSGVRIRRITHSVHSPHLELISRAISQPGHCVSRRGRAAAGNVSPLRPSAATLTMADLKPRDRRTPVCGHCPTQHHLRITHSRRQISNRRRHSSSDGCGGSLVRICRFAHSVHSADVKLIGSAVGQPGHRVRSRRRVAASNISPL